MATKLFVLRTDKNGDDIGPFTDSIIANPTGNTIPGIVKISRKNDPTTFVQYTIDALPAGPGGTGVGGVLIYGKVIGGLLAFMKSR